MNKLFRNSVASDSMSFKIGNIDKLSIVGDVRISALQGEVKLNWDMNHYDGVVFKIFNSYYGITKTTSTPSFELVDLRPGANFYITIEATSPFYKAMDKLTINVIAENRGIGNMYVEELLDTVVTGYLFRIGGESNGNGGIGDARIIADYPLTFNPSSTILTSDDKSYYLTSAVVMDAKKYYAKVFETTLAPSESKDLYLEFYAPQFEQVKISLQIGTTDKIESPYLNLDTESQLIAIHNNVGYTISSITYTPGVVNGKYLMVLHVDNLSTDASSSIRLDIGEKLMVR